MTSVAFHFDFVSPYSYLALTQAERFGRDHGVSWRLRPVVYAKLLEAFGLKGPAEVPVRRRVLLQDIRRCAAALSVPLVGPPRHPFRSLEALRLAFLFRDHPRGLQLSRALASAAWGDGKDLTNLDVLAEVTASEGIDPTALAERISAPEVKDGLRELTRAAMQDGVFGVPTFVVEDQLFWGHDRLDHLARHLAARDAAE